MSLRITVLILILASGATTVSAQAKLLPQLSLSHGGTHLIVRTYNFSEPATPSRPGMNPGLTCPMPVFRTPGAYEDPMPVDPGGANDPMPVARSGCWNPLFPEY